MKNTNLPIFIGGCGRSGTTLLGSMLGAHKDCLCIPESQFKTDMINEFDKNNINELVISIKNNVRFRLWNLDINTISIENINSYGDVLEFFINEYSKKVSRSNFKMWIDHTPNNLEYVKQLKEIYPQAKFIHLVRDGRGVASSIIPLDWGPNTVKSAANLWKTKLSYGLAAEQFVNKDDIFRVKYEELVIDPEKTLKEICEFLGIVFQKSMIDGNGFSPPKYTTKQHDLVGTKPNKSRTEAWKHKLDSREIEIFECLTADLLECMGYSRLYEGSYSDINRRELIFLNIKELSRYFYNRIHYQIRRNKNIKIN
ncbi:sulfotransferase [Halobacillus salinarum]|uniref:Sulfotransferase n=1 Tax=Halobacillus salinarum TaxID=2932257 RepID=A0ABY4ENI2_9BACI|nr:sulfotransferase [Halobacillus salinarum]UOQ45393.1 sulfotransferase [Halobacillus salinarum]